MSNVEFRTYESLVDEVSNIGVPAFEARHFVSEAIWEGSGKIKDKRTGDVFTVERWRRGGPCVVLSSDWDVFHDDARPVVSSGSGLRAAIIRNPDFLFESAPVLRYIETIYHDFLKGRRFSDTAEARAATEGGGEHLPERRQETRGRKKTKGLEEAKEDLLDRLKNCNDAGQTLTEKAEWLEAWFVNERLPPPGRTTLMDAARLVADQHCAWVERYERIEKFGNEQVDS